MGRAGGVDAGDRDARDNGRVGGGVGQLQVDHAVDDSNGIAEGDGDVGPARSGGDVVVGRHLIRISATVDKDVELATSGGEAWLGKLQLHRVGAIGHGQG